MLPKWRPEKAPQLGLRCWNPRLLTIAALSAISLFLALPISLGSDEKNREPHKTQGLIVVAADAGHPKITVSDGEGQHVYNLAENSQVEINGVSTTIDQLSTDDVVSIVLNARNEVTEVRASRFRSGIVLSVTPSSLELTTDYTDREVFALADQPQILLDGKEAAVTLVRRGDQVRIIPDAEGRAQKIQATRRNLLADFWDNFRHNLFKPLLLFFYLGFIVPLLKIEFEFPRVMYQGLTIYLLLSIGWRGGEELADLSGAVLLQAVQFMVIGFCVNFAIGVVSYLVLRAFIPRMRRIDSATIAAYYGSDSAGTFVTCLGVLAASGIKYAPYMPVMLAVMEIPGCLVGLWLVSRLRRTGMDPLGNMPDEPGYNPNITQPVAETPLEKIQHDKAVDREVRMALENKEEPENRSHHATGTLALLREVFFNPGLFLLFGGIAIGFISRLQGHKVTDADDNLFVTLFQGLLCLFLLEMGMTASSRLKDLKSAGWRFILFGLLAPIVFASVGILAAHGFALVTGTPLQLGTYALFAVLCAAASYIAVPAIQRLAMPEASPTLPLAASLGLTFSFNVTLGIPIYLILAEFVILTWPVGGR